LYGTNRINRRIDFFSVPSQDRDTMLTSDDLKAIGSLFDEKLKQQDVRLNKKLKKQLDEKLAKQKEEILKGVSDYIHDELVPLFR
jgi:hypothetical protein